MKDFYVPRSTTDLYFEEFTWNSGHEHVYFVLNTEVPAWAFINSDSMDILNLCDGQNSVKNIAQLISRNNGISQKDMTKIVKEFLEGLLHDKVLLKTSKDTKPDNLFSCLALEITKQCNLRCRHCYLSAGNPHPNELSLEEIRSLFRAAKNAGAQSTSIGGGEPLLRDDLFNIIDSAIAEGLMVSIGTNGTLINQDISQKLAEYQLKIQISLDGATPETHDLLRGQGAFSQTVKGLDLLLSQDLGKDIVIAFTPSKLNIDETPDIIQFGLDRGIPVIQFPPLSPSGRAKSNWEELKLSNEEILRFWDIVSEKASELKGEMDLLADCFSMNISRSGAQTRCSIGTQVRVDPAGNVFPCQCFHSGQEYCLGNVRNSKFDEIVAGQKLRNIKQECFDRPNLIEECQECPWRNFCGSGCMGSAYERTGAALRPNDCEARMQWIRKLFHKELEKVITAYEG